MNEFNLDEFLSEPDQPTGSKSSNFDKQAVLNKLAYLENSASNAINPKSKASGRYQIMPENQKKFGLTDPSNDQLSGDVAFKLYQDAHQRYSKLYPNKSADEIEQLVLADYNGGPKAVNALLSGKPWKETSKYLQRHEQYLSSNGEKTGLTSNSDFDLNSFMSEPDLQTEAPVTQSPEFKQLTPEQKKLSNEYSHNRLKTDSGVDSLNVALDSAIRAGSAGFIQPGWATKQMREDHPIADVAGSMAGTLPYAFVPGGLPVQMGTMAARGAAQTLNEGGTGSEAALSAALEGVAPAVGPAVGKVAKLAGNVIKKPAEALAQKAVNYYRGPEATALIKTAQEADTQIKNINKLLSEGNLDKESVSNLTKQLNDLQKVKSNFVKNYETGFPNQTNSKMSMTSQAAQNKFDLKKELSSAITAGLLPGSAAYIFTADEESKLLNAALAVAGGGSLKFAAAQLAKELPKYSPQIAEQVLKYIAPKTKVGPLDINQMDITLGRIAKTKTPEGLSQADRIKATYSNPAVKEARALRNVGVNYNLLGDILERKSKPVGQALGFSSLIGGNKIREQNK